MKTSALITLFLLGTAVVVAQDVGVLRSVDSTRKVKTDKPLRAAIDVSWLFGIDASTFFQDYRVALGGTKSEFSTPTAVGFGVEAFQFENIAIGVMAGFYRASVRESYFYDPELRPQRSGPAQSVTQIIEMDVIPAYAFIDYFGVHRQFTGYIGAGVGLASINMYWYEELSPSTEFGARQSGIRYDDASLNFASMVRTGVSLGFDDPLTGRANAAIYVEMAYSYIPFSAPLFEKTAQTLLFTTDRMGGNYSIQAGGISFKLGFSVILSNRKESS